MLRFLLLMMVSQYSFAQLMCRPFAEIEHRWMNHEDPAKIYRSSEYPAQAYVVSAFYTNCPACNQSHEPMKRLYQDYLPSGDVQVLSIGRDCRLADYQRWIRMYAPEHPILNDCDMRTLGRLGTRTYPTTFILDCQLKIVHSYSGALTSEIEADLRQRLDTLLANGCSSY